MKSSFLILVFFVFILSTPQVFAQDFVPAPEDCSTPWDDDGDGDVNEGCPQSAAFTNPGTGEYIAPLEDCVLQGMETASDSDPIHSGTIVRLSSSLPWNRQQIKCAGTFANGTYNVYLVYRGTAQILNVWVKLDAALTNYPGNATEASFLTQSSGWKADVPIGTVGSLAQFYACVYQSNCANQTSPRAFALNGAHSLFLKFSPGVEGACLYAVNPSAATPNPRCTGGEGTPTSNYVFLRTTNTITLDHADLAGANLMTFANPSNNNTSTITVKGLWKDDTTNRAYIQYETNDADIITAMGSNDGAFSTAEDHFDFRLRADLNQLTDSDLYQVLGNFGPFWLDANFPGGTRSATASLNASVSTSGGKMLLAFDLPGSIAAGSQFLCNANARDRDTDGTTTYAHMHGSTTSAMFLLSEFGVCETSNNLTNPGAPDTTAPTVSSCSAVSVTSSSFIAQCTTDEAGTAWVEYDLDNDSAVAGTDKVTLGGSSVAVATFQLPVTGRPASTLHEWVVKVRDAAGNIGTGSIVDTTTSATACDYYASNAGGGDGSAEGKPFQIENFWALGESVMRGKTLCLLDGTYTGANSMIDPPQNVNGTASQKITIKALNDGAVTIDGQVARIPIRLLNNDYFVIEGVNAKNGNSDTVSIQGGADNNTIRRVCAWNANPAANARTWGVGGTSPSVGNLLEDICGFGTGRRTLGITQGGTTDIIVRRGWFQWNEQTLVTGPQTPVQCCYNTTNNLFENIISTTDWTGSGSSTFNAGAIGFHIGGEGGNHRVMGSIFYLPAGANANNQSNLVYSDWSSSVAHGPFLFKDIVIYTAQASKRPFLLSNSLSCASCYLTNTTEIGGVASSVGSYWIQTNRVDVDNVGSAPNIWNGGGTNGARVCKRYVNGTLTTTPLWPWPMNQRIIDAMTAAGKTPVDVTATMESIFGTIPAECRSS